MNKTECFLGRYLDLTGQRFNRLTVIKLNGKDSHNHYQWECQCDCGNKLLVDTATLRTGHTRSCGCLRKEYWRDKKRKEPYQWLYTYLLRRCKVGNIDCNLTFEDFKGFTSTVNCHYCNSPIVWEEYSSDKINKSKCHSTAYYLDRKDNTEGYSIKNCVVCCSLCNSTKSNRFNYEEMLKLGNVVGEIQAQRKHLQD